LVFCFFGGILPKVDKLPESLVSRFAIAARDVLWFKDRVLRVFERAGVPRPVMADLKRRRNEPTIKLAQQVVDLLEQMDEPGRATLQKLIAEVADWTDLSHLKPDQRAQARTSQAELKKAIREYADQQKFLKRRERDHQREREARVEVSQLDHVKLQGFRDEFDRAFTLTDPQKRGNALEKLLNDVFDYYCPRNRGPFRRVGEQVDGNFYFDNHHYFCEIRWLSAKAIAADISVLRDRATAGFGGDVKALFISFNGFTDECLKALNSRAAAERVILMDGMDLRSILNADIAFEVLLEEKQAYAVRNQRAFVSAREIVLARLDSGRR
jgi:hypothetical protein